MSLTEWELRFETALRNIPATQLGKAGAVLSVIPRHDEWEQFVAKVRQEWRHWEWAFATNPACAVVFYDGVAFFNYQSGAFWNDFADAVNSPPLTANVQTAINRIYATAAKRFGLRVISSEYVVSAVSHIGIPLSMWDGFLQVCEWALWTEDWALIDDAAWKAAMTRRLGGRVLLIRFLTDNRATASEFIREMLGARQILATDQTISLSDVEELVFLRSEYFDEVPETADFLRPDNPETLLADRGRLAWNEDRAVIALHLPPVRAELLPATWRLDGIEQPAASTASEFVLNDRAFSGILRLELTSSAPSSSQRIGGINGWALYDEARARLLNRERELLPVSQYTVISRQPLKPELEGWSHDPDDPAIDIPHNLSDGTPIFLTRLFPASRRPRLRVHGGGWLTFAQRRNVELRVFCGSNQQNAARFSMSSDGTIFTETWPRPFLEVPLSLVPDDNIPEEFTVYLDGQPALGRWKSYDFDPPNHDENTAERAFCFWQWDAVPSTLGRHILHVESRRLGRLPFGVARECRFELVGRTPDAMWPAAWGDYIAWVFLAHTRETATWEEVRFAREAVTMWASVKLNAVYYQIRKLERHGYLAVRGHRYLNFRSRIAFGTGPDGAFRGEYCGLTSMLYDVVRKVQPRRIAIAPPEQGRPSKLLVDWAHRDRDEVRSVCHTSRLESVQKLW